jgi:hypothetical protein
MELWEMIAGGTQTINENQKNLEIPKEKLARLRLKTLERGSVGGGESKGGQEPKEAWLKEAGAICVIIPNTCPISVLG